MSKYVHPDVQDGALLVIKNAGTRLLLLSNYSGGMTYAQAVAAALATAVLAPTDSAITAVGGARVLTIAAGKTATLSAAATGTDAHVVITDGTARILAVTDETSNPTAPVGATVTFPAIPLTASAAV